MRCLGRRLFRTVFCRLVGAGLPLRGLLLIRNRLLAMTKMAFGRSVFCRAAQLLVIYLDALHLRVRLMTCPITVGWRCFPRWLLGWEANLTAIGGAILTVLPSCGCFEIGGQYRCTSQSFLHC